MNNVIATALPLIVRPRGLLAGLVVALSGIIAAFLRGIAVIVLTGPERLHRPRLLVLMGR